MFRLDLLHDCSRFLALESRGTDETAALRGIAEIITYARMTGCVAGEKSGQIQLTNVRASAPGARGGGVAEHRGAVDVRDRHSARDAVELHPCGGRAQLHADGLVQKISSQHRRGYGAGCGKTVGEGRARGADQVVGERAARRQARERCRQTDHIVEALVVREGADRGAVPAYVAGPSSPSDYSVHGAEVGLLPGHDEIERTAALQVADLGHLAGAIEH